MSSGPRILHISRTPLVGAPGKIVQALNRHTRFESALIVGRDYPAPLKGFFLDAAVLFDAKGPVAQLCAELIQNAHVIHIHNDLPEELRGGLLGKASPSCKFVYQVHSPLREGPLFFDRSEQLGVDLHARLSIPHYPQRFFPDYKLVPNIVLARPSVRPLAAGVRPRILFSPAHERKGLRWGDKVSTALDKALAVVETLGLAEVIQVRGMMPAALIELRRSTHITIDEIVTGAFHQISLEGLATGNVVVNGADDFALLSLQAACESAVHPPFVRAGAREIAERLTDLLRDRARIARLQHASYEHFMEHMRPERLIRRFVQVYEEVLG